MRPLDQLDRAVARWAGLTLDSGFLGLVSPTLWTQLQPYVLEVLAIWAAARVAATRVDGGDHTSTDVYLLRRGEQLLQSSDPVATLRGWLPGENDLR